MQWCTGPLKDAERLREIYVILENREANRRSQTTKNKSSNHPYTAQVAQLGINWLKNRYCDIYPYDSNRLILANPIHDNDYVNASWIIEPDFSLPSHLRDQVISYHPSESQTWIAAQAPLHETCYEFLSLCLSPNPSQRPQVIIQLTACHEGGREKSARYIPNEVGSSIEFWPYQSARTGTSKSTGLEKYRWASLEPLEKTFHGLIRVTLQSSVPGPIQSPDHSDSGRSSWPTVSFYRKNTLLLELCETSQNNTGNLDGTTPFQKNSLIRRVTVTHYECIDWPDRGIPSSVEPILELIQCAQAGSVYQLADSSEPMRSPVLVHCSAGVGRTGTLIAIASCSARLSFITRCFPSTHKVEAMGYLQSPQLTQESGRMPDLPKSLNSDLVAHTIDFLREQRVCMVQTEGQVGFVYKAVAQLLTSLLA